MGSRWALAVVAAGGGALALRSAALDFGLPAVYNPDEIAIMSRALAFAKGDLNPHNFVYPSFYFYALFAWVGGLFAWQRLTGVVGSAQEFQARFFIDPSGVYLAGRALSAACGALTVAAVAALGRTLFDKTTALSAAALLAVLPLAVQDAHYVKHDVPATLLVTVALWLMARCLTGPPATSRRLALAAVFCGVAWSTHYYTVFLAAPLALTAWSARRARGWRAVVGSTAACGVLAAAVFFLLSPFLLVEPGTAWRDIVANRQIVVDRAADAGPLAGAARYGELLVAPGATWPVVAAALAGVVLVIRRSPLHAAFLLSFPATFFAFIVNTVPASRYLNPLLPLVALLAAVGITAAARRVAPAAPGVAAAALTVVIGAAAATGSLRIVGFFAHTDTRTLAQRVIEAQAPAGATVLIQPYSVQLAQSRESLIESVVARLGSIDRASTRARLRLAVSPWPQPSYRLLWLGEGGLDDDKIYLSYRELAGDPLGVLRSAGVDYVVLKRFEREDPAVAPLARALAEGARLVASVSPYRDPAEAERPTVPPYLHNADAVVHRELARPGPIIDVYAIGEAGRRDDTMGRAGADSPIR